MHRRSSGPTGDEIGGADGSNEPVIITRSGEPPVVMMAQEDFKALAETAYLLRSPRNAKRLLESIAEFELGRGVERDLLE